MLQQEYLPRLLQQANLTQPEQQTGLPNDPTTPVFQPQAQQKKGLLQSPEFISALGSLGASLGLSAERGFGVGTGLALGANAFGNRLQQEQNRTRQAEQVATQNLLALMKDDAEARIMEQKEERAKARLAMDQQAADRSQQAFNFQVQDRNEAKSAANASQEQFNNFLESNPQYAELASIGGREAVLDVYNNQFDMPEATTEIGKITQDYKNGFITEAQYREQSASALEDSGQDVFKNENDLRDEYNALSKDFIAVDQAYNRVQASVVRESEFRTAGEAGSLPTRVQAGFNRVKDGELLAPRQRADFKTRAEKLYEAANKSQEPVRDRYIGLAKRNKLNPINVVDALPSIEPAPKATENVVSYEEYF